MCDDWGYAVLTSTALAKVEGDIHAEALKKGPFEDDVSTVASTCHRGRTVSMAEARGRTVSMAEAMPSCWTKRSVLALCHELLTGFSAPDFQEELQKLRAKAPNDLQVAGRMELALTAQKKILPKFGFPATPEGVEAMRDAICPYLMDYMVKMVVDDIDKILGLPPNSTANAAMGPGATREEARREARTESTFTQRQRQLSASSEEDSTSAPPSCADSLESLQEQIPSSADIEVIDFTPFSANKDSEFSREKVLRLCTDLLGCFSASEFQEALQPILARSKGRKAVPERTALALKVQSKVLPNYGLPGTMGGVLMMLDKIAPYAGDWMVVSLVNSIDEKLGLPANTTISSLPSPE